MLGRDAIRHFNQTRKLDLGVGVVCVLDVIGELRERHASCVNFDRRVAQRVSRALQQNQRGGSVQASLSTRLHERLFAFAAIIYAEVLEQAGQPRLRGNDGSDSGFPSEGKGGAHATTLARLHRECLELHQDM